MDDIVVVEDTGLLAAYAPEGTDVVVERDYDGKREEARVAEGGIIRERDGEAAYSAGAYGVIEIA